MAATLLLHAQETAGASFDLRDESPQLWQDGVWVVLDYGFLLLLWPTVGKIVVPYRDSWPWRSLRYIIPTFTVLVSAIIVSVAILTGQSGMVFLAAAIHLPALLVALPMIVLLSSAGSQVALYFIAPILWLTWYGIIVLLENRAWRDSPLSFKGGR
ncbi:MAG: hypothetical protein ABI995_03855 [Acidobacteriota bacterium]